MFESTVLGNVFGTTSSAQQQGAMHNVPITNTTGAPWRLHNTPEKEVAFEYGVPYASSSGKPIPDDWRGAQLTGWDRSLEGTNTNGTHPRWAYRMFSDWSNDVVVLYLDANEVSGGEADKIAGTYMEALNQRRIG